MNFIERIRNCFETATGLKLLYGSREEINRAIGDGTLPVGFFTLVDTTTAEGDSFALREVGTLTIAVVDLSPTEEPGYNSEAVVEACKVKVMGFVQRLRERKDLRLDAIVRTNRIYDEFDDIVTGYSVTARVTDLQGYDCAGEQVKTTATYTENGTYNAESIDMAVVAVEGKEIQAEKSVEPSTSLVEVFPDAGFDGIAKVTVSAVTSSIDPNIQAGNIRKDTAILGVTGTLDPAKEEQAKSADPATSAQTVLPDEGKVLSSVEISAVTSAIDSNIKAENIKKDTTILGVTGTLESGGKIEAEKSVDPTTAAQSVEPSAGYDGIGKVNVSAVTAAIDSNITADHIVKDVTILGVTGSVEPPIYNASREWSAAHPTYDNAEDILADYTAGICYIFLGSITLTIPSNGTHYYTKDGEVTAGSTITLECEEGKETSWLVEEYESGATATMMDLPFLCIGVGMSAVSASILGIVNNTMCSALWVLNGSTASSAGNLDAKECIYTDDTSVVSVYRIRYYRGKAFVGNTSVTTSQAWTSNQCVLVRNTYNYPESARLGSSWGNSSYVSVFEFPNLHGVNGNSGSLYSTYRIQFGRLVYWYGTTNSAYLLDIEVGTDTDIDLPWSGWTCTSVTADKSASLLLISNTRRHILDKVADHSGETDARTITCGWVSTLAESTDEDIQDALLMLQMDFSDKGWLLT